MAYDILGGVPTQFLCGRDQQSMGVGVGEGRGKEFQLPVNPTSPLSPASTTIGIIMKTGVRCTSRLAS